MFVCLFLTGNKKLRHREIKHLASGKLVFWTWNVWFHVSNQTASWVHTPSTSHSTTLAPGFSPTWRAAQSRLASLLILHSTLLSPAPVAPGPSSYFVTTLLLQLPLSVTGFFLHLFKIWQSFRSWLISPTLHKVFLNSQNIHSFILFIQYFLNTYCIPGTALSNGIKRTKFLRLLLS